MLALVSAEMKMEKPMLKSTSPFVLSNPEFRQGIFQMM
jgi:hypothetical protein